MEQELKQAVRTTEKTPCYICHEPPLSYHGSLDLLVGDEFFYKGYAIDIVDGFEELGLLARRNENISWNYGLISHHVLVSACHIHSGNLYALLKMIKENGMVISSPILLASARSYPRVETPGFEILSFDMKEVIADLRQFVHYTEDNIRLLPVISYKG
ncbi:MAG: hypothetical protein ABII01_07645 [Candidatus Woesearchaeota archaeon]